MHSFYKPIVIFFILFVHLIYPHGFGPATFVRYGNGWCDIQQICSNISRKQNQYILSNDLHTGESANCKVKSAGNSISTCYFKLCFEKTHNDDILCTPSQEFYVASIKKWVPAYQLKISDELLSGRNTTKRLTYIEFVKRPVKVYTIEVEESHTFFVGRHSILTHNMVFPVMFCSGLAIPITSGVGGTIIGMLTASVPLVTASLIFCVSVGYVAKKIFSDRVLHYKLSYNATEIEQYRAHINKMDPVVPPNSNIPPQVPGGGEPPLDPKNLPEKIKQAIEAGLKYCMQPAKYKHIFDEAKHNLAPLIAKFGNEEAAARAILTAAYISKSIPESGVFEEISINVGGYIVTIRGFVDGIIKLGTFFIKDADLL